jgi:pimeloyl-ACP methyl ester carboxylesterase
VEREFEVRADGIRLAARAWGREGTGVLLLHGLASSSRVWDLVAPRFAGGFRVVAYDQRGHGMSGKPSSGYGFERVTADAVAVQRAARIVRPVVVGHSWGANVALELAVRHPRRVGGVVLVDGGFLNLRDRMDWRTTKERLAPPVLRGTPVHEFLEIIRYFLHGQIEITPEVERVFLSLMRVDRDGNIHPRLSRANHLRILRALWEQDALGLLRWVRAPTLVLAARSVPGTPDPAGFMEEKVRASAAVKAIGEPVRFAWIDGVHDVPLQRPAAVASRIRRFAVTAGA